MGDNFPAMNIAVHTTMPSSDTTEVTGPSMECKSSLCGLSHDRPLAFNMCSGSMTVATGPSMESIKKRKTIDREIRIHKKGLLSTARIFKLIF